MMSFRYSLYGLNLHVDTPIPGLQPLSDGQAIDVRVVMGSVPFWMGRLLEGPLEDWYVSPYATSRRQPLLKGKKTPGRNYLCLQHYDGVEFVFARKGDRVWVTWPDSIGIKQATDHLIYWGLSYLLRLRGMTVLHAGAITVNGRALALCGPENSGKSTLIAELARRGYAVLSDDTVCLSTDLVAQPGYPWLCLREASLATLSGSGLLPRLSSPWLFREEYFVSVDLEENGYRFQEYPVPLGAVYCLQDPAVESERAGIERPIGRDALLTLVQRTCAKTLLDASMRAREFDLLGRLVSCVPVREVPGHSVYRDPSVLCDRILADVEYLHRDDSNDSIFA